MMPADWQEIDGRRQNCHWWRNLHERRLSAMDIIIAFAALIALVVALAPHHRRTAGLPRAPLGADLDVDHDIDRVLHDLTTDR
ncbi:hypothetical protein FHX52_3985 [Humibacillus xanthopallidus]|uniref:Uncharacterized protein n=2 Tax=Humibacillus xanthopallidus TaxID=412689 RepID=A0A543PL22_9MICO|nr:hypothetical protein FHX52_3985 [Humibacillus xanthopallidus]